MGNYTREKSHLFALAIAHSCRNKQQQWYERERSLFEPEDVLGVRVYVPTTLTDKMRAKREWFKRAGAIYSSLPENTKGSTFDDVEKHLSPLFDSWHAQRVGKDYVVLTTEVCPPSSVVRIPVQLVH